MHTGQHYDDAMSDLFFRELDLPEADVNLGVGSGTHGAQTAGMLLGIEGVAVTNRPDWMLIYGDTNSTLAGALVAAKLHIPIAHVEAGLRSYDRRMPEEVNRVVADHLSDLLLCPTEHAVENLAKEGISQGVHMAGDVMLDAFRQNLQAAKRTTDAALSSFGVEPRSYALLTVHRAENVDQPHRLARILEGVSASGMPVVFPVHPRTRAALGGDGRAPQNVKLVEPVGYLEMLVLEACAEVVVTDSGGVQKEAYFARRPCVTLRDRTEWTETTSTGWNVLTGTDPQRIAEAMRMFRPDGPSPEVFGDGHAAERVVELLEASASRSQ